MSSYSRKKECYFIQGGHKRSRWENLSSTSALADKSFK